MNIRSIGDSILDETLSSGELREALDAFTKLCGDIGGVRPDPSFNAWAEDTLLDSGVAINPKAAAHCVLDYRRSVVFIRGVYAAINALKVRFGDTPLEILYAGCGPFATLLLPLLGKFSPGELKITLLDIHQRSLDSVGLLLSRFGYDGHAADLIKADASNYKHPKKLHLAIAETLQKSLEQEPQFAVTANLAAQLLPAGIFIPQCIEVGLYLADLKQELKQLNSSEQIIPTTVAACTGRRHLATLCSLRPEHALGQMRAARLNADTNKLELDPIFIMIPPMADIAHFDAALFTRIVVFEQYRLGDYESQITLPLKCHELAQMAGGQRYRINYQLGSYPKFNFELVAND